jgi:alcohol dehydrogenase class IV
MVKLHRPGLGGGSPMDMAKLTALAATNNQTPRQLLVDKIVNKAPLKKILIPTTSGTGSEVSMFLVSSIGKDKYAIPTTYNYPEVAIIDPGLTLSMPPRVTASTGIDALSHAIDSLMHKFANPLYDSLGLAEIELVASISAGRLSNGQDSPVSMSIGATLCDVHDRNRRALHTPFPTFWPYQRRSMGSAARSSYTMAPTPADREKLAAVARALGAKTDLFPAGCREKVREVGLTLSRIVKLPVSLKEMGFRHEDATRWPSSA